jgi:hypothetical protein
MILKIFSPKNFAKKLAFFAQNKAKLVLRFFSECQVSEHQISERHIAEIRTKVIFPKSHLFEWPKVQHNISLNFMFPKRKIVNQLVRICSNKSQPIGLLFLVTILPLGAYLG